jgi:DNA-directed RNA polymerase specialized sigma subunit
MSRKSRAVGIFLAAVILVGTLSGLAFAQSGAQAFPEGNYYQNFVAKLAANLGMEQSEVTTALDKTKQQMLDEAVQQGSLTQEQADQMAKRMQDGCGLPGFRGAQKHDRGAGFGRNLDNMATVLGMTTDELRAELKSGKKIQQIAQDKGMTLDQFREKMLEVKKEALAKAVSDGKLTQDQADKMLQRMEQNHTAPNSDLNQ